MLTGRRPVGVLLVVSLTLLVVPANVYAEGVGAPVDCGRNSSAPGCDVQVGLPGQPSRPGNGGGSGGGSGEPGPSDPNACRYERLDDGMPPPPGARLPGAWYVQRCPLPGGGEAQSRAEWISGGVAPSPAVLAMEAVARLGLPLPAVRTNPATATVVLVNVPVWVWQDPAAWGRRSATAAVPGLAVTATATATRVVYSTGDGATVTCTGPGTPWTAGTDPLKPSPTCGWVYRRSSAGQPGNAFTLTATVTWTVSWVGGGASGTVPPLTVTAAVAVRVAESQSIVTGTGV